MRERSVYRAGWCLVSAMALLGSSVATPSDARADAMADLIAGAKQEGELTIIAVPHDWCRYADIIDSFKAKYPFLKLNELDPDAGSGDEIEAIKANKDNKGPQNPDVIDVGLSFGPSSKAEGLIQPYKVSTWDSIPEGQKDAEGYWYGNYYGVLSFEINADLVPNPPADWPDLLKPEYANMVALDDDPRSSNMSMQSVFASGLSASGGDPDKAAEAGLSFFAELNKSGNLVPAGGNAATLAQGTTPIVLRWDYLALGDRDTLNGNPPVTIVVPKTGIVAGVYVSAINAYAPHPNAAKLWMEHLYSDESQLKWLEGYCHPIRFADLVKNNKVPQALLDKLPPAEAYEKALFPSLEVQGKAKEIITGKWAEVVGANIE
ncbi:MAG: ABC transporter substrate-binding protein [Rhodospirillaceae bacterium]|nr:ABC transporter substrate-binding protein [Rhodospirillaceae bacterium]